MNNFHIDKPESSVYRIAVDVDLTLVDSLNPWIEWYNDRCHNAVKRSFMAIGSEFRPITRDCYIEHRGDLAILMTQRLEALPRPLRFDPMGYWRSAHLYDDLNPLEGAINFLVNIKRLLESNHSFNRVEFVAVSKCEPEHERSKRRFIEKFENLFSGFISTNEKHLLAVDCLIDDNPDYVEACVDNAILQIYVPQGNYETFVPRHDANYDLELLQVDSTMLEEDENHFHWLNRNIEAVAKAMVDHFFYVR